MTSFNSFVATSSLSGLTAVPQDSGTPLVHDAPRVLGLLRERAPALAGLFASPLLAPPAPGQPPTNASWYGIHDRAARTLSEAQPSLRDQAVADLRHLLRQALDLRQDPDLGPLLPALLTLPSTDSVMAAGGHPVLINWGLGPPGLDTSAEGLRAHFDALFGPLCGVTWPVEGNSSAAVGAGAGGVAGIAAAAAAAAAPGDASPTAAPTSAIPPTPASAQGPAQASTTEPNQPAAPVARGWPAALPVVLAVALGLLILALIWWLLWAPGGLFNRAPAVVTGIHDAVIDSLRRERDRLRGLEGLTCGPALDEALREGYTRPLDPHQSAPLAVPSEPVPPADPGTQAEPVTPAHPDAPPPPEASPLPPPPDLAALPSAPATRMTALARALEYSAALVMGESAQGTALGTAFFITPDTLITNRHVVEDLRPTDRLLITSQALGSLVPARVVARTPSSRIGGPDFAVLRLDAPRPNAVPLAIAPTVEKLSRVVTAGYPGYIAQSDSAFDTLLEGRSAAAPSMVFTSGEVSVVQRQPSGTTIVVHTADMSQGNSGGPLVDLCGRVVGVNTFIGMDEESGRRGLYALSGADLLAFLATSGISATRSDTACAAEEVAPAAGGDAPPADGT